MTSQNGCKKQQTGWFWWNAGGVFTAKGESEGEKLVEDDEETYKGVGILLMIEEFE